MAWLPGGEKIVNIGLLVLTQFTNVTDGQTDRQTDTHTDNNGIDRAYAYSIARQKLAFFDQYLALFRKRYKIRP